MNYHFRSNKCEIKRALLTSDPIDNLNVNLLINPFVDEKTRDEEPSYIQAPVPTINLWVTNKNTKKTLNPLASPKPQEMEPLMY